LGIKVYSLAGPVIGILAPQGFTDLLSKGFAKDNTLMLTAVDIEL
jgi:hypothetical protein